jgi:hypothetical protein
MTVSRTSATMRCCNGPSSARSQASPSPGRSSEPQRRVENGGAPSSLQIFPCRSATVRRPLLRAELASGASRLCAISNSFRLCLIPLSPLKRALRPWETSMASVTDGFSHVLLFSCPKCGNPLASAWASTEKNLGRADAQRLERKCDCGWSGPLVGAQALRHWIEPWKNPVDVEPEGRRLRRQPHPGRSSACPKCASPLNHKSRRKGVVEQILHTVFFISPLRCEVCDERYFRVRLPAARSVHKHDSHAA